MPASEASAKKPNLRLMEARRRLPSPRWPNLRMSRSDVADGVNAKLHELYPDRKDLKYHTVDFRWVGKLERGDRDCTRFG
ncbi:hypothetical protein [Verrucosispora sp. NA02020]|uniref:hypothetical protein n=1 Tax=Verrucosispora sp. NA02020 TaxID=2742132 RepID=UPI0015921DC3|nr:hypothetical protein [Verrucosispora sp. NA02020]